ncbi:hypothetical protein [Microbulbifer aestuariivivens]|uniref:hypothetical protein n=1 Tax=Microbulbifer aestuariivivens TaxID=1908308 RepID=UPI0031E94242
MSDCEHQLSAFKSVICSGPFKMECSKCGAQVYREHHRTESVFEALGFLSGIPLLLLIVLIVWLPYVVFFCVGFLGAVYAWDTQSNRLKTFDSKQQLKEKQKNRRLIIGVLLVVFLGLLAELYT